jgi:hypothetical protein
MRIWEFKTKRFLVTCEVGPEDMDPADSFQFDEDIEAVRNGDVEWFHVEVVVRDRKTSRTLGHDSLGGCAYKTFDEFVTGHRDSNPEYRNTLANKARKRVICHYFPSMVSEAIRDARENAKRFCDLRTVK